MPKGDGTNVLIAGAGPVGLALAIDLGLRGIDCVLVEQGDGKLRVPRMSSVSARGMEFCRRWGIADKVRDAVWSRTHPNDFVYLSTMVGEELARLKIGSHRERQGNLDYSPEGAASCPQIYFDPILAEKATSLPSVSVRYGTRLDSFDQFETGVSARLVDTESGEEMSIAADYLVGCDGAGGIVRRRLGIPLEGLGPIATSVNVFFRSPEFAAIHDKGWAHIYRFFDEAGCWAELIAIDGKELWRLSVFHDPNPDLTGASYLRKLAGCDFPYAILDVSPWQRPDFPARTYPHGRVLNPGAPVLTPTDRLLGTIAWRIGDGQPYALEGSVFLGGAVVQWLRDGLGIIRSAAEVEALALSVPDNGGVYFVPAFTGLGAPHWDQYARGTICGLTRGTTAAHLARAALESIAFQVADVIHAMERDADLILSELRVDGGAAANDLLMQFQADILDTKVLRPQIL